MGALLGVQLLKKSTPKQLQFLPISHKNIFFKNQFTRLGVIVTPYEGLE